MRVSVLIVALVYYFVSKQDTYIRTDVGDKLLLFFQLHLFHNINNNNVYIL